jgi:hypothetical protein
MGSDDAVFHGHDCKMASERSSGRGDRILGLAAWGSLLIPLGFLLVISWGIRRFVNWIRVGFAGWTRNRKGAEVGHLDEPRSVPS